MASTVQERLQLNRVPLDKWSTREQLCLASAVSCSGDQNWMSVSRTLKLVCGNGTPTRPADWYSQKNCALQFGHMLENVETPKRKKRTSESGSGISSPAIVETPTDSILRRLNDERIQELKAEIRREQEEFAKIYRELKALQSGTLSEEQMREMWSSIEKQQEQERVEEMKLENLMREREQQKMEMQRNWRSFVPTTTPSISASPASAADTTSVDMDVEEITQTSSTQHASNAVNNQTQHQQQQPGTQPATSPLLSSLLKTPSPGNSTPPTLSKNTMSSTTNISARSSAPTITTLLTSGYVPNKNQPAITLKASIPPQKAAQLLSSPISGPPTMTSIPVTTITPHNLLSPSQAAPTLSMLLEKNKGSATSEENRNDTLIPKVVERNVQTQLDDVQKVVADSNNGEIAMELEDGISTTEHDSNVNILNSNDSDDPDPNEEQQLLEVFKNIGNIDELDIDVSAVIDDEEVDFLKDMAADSPSEDTHVRDFERDGTDDSKIMNEVDVNIEDSGEKEKEENPERLDNTDDVGESQVKDSQTVANILENKPGKGETISSDDSNDNIPLAAVASLEQKSAQDKVGFKENTDEAIGNEGMDDNCETDKSQRTRITKSRLDSFEDDDKDHDKLEKELADLVGANETDESKNLEEDGKSPVVSENSDVIVIPTDDDDSSGDKARQANEKSNDEEAAKIKKDLESDIGSLEVSKETSELGYEMTEMGDTNNAAVVSLQPTISIADTDDDSSATDNSIVTRKDDKAGNSSIKYNTPQVRKSLHEPTRQDPQSKTDDESTTQFSSSSSSSVTPARPPLLRKLRDRDRSESPLIETETHNGGNIANTAGTENSGSQRLRRRYSSTPVNDSVPNSPASSDRDRDDSETRMSKKSLLSIFHALQYSKNASTMQRLFHEDCKFNEICLRPTDMHTIRKQIETGTIRNVTELQRDIMLMCQNGLMLFKHNTIGYNAANAFIQECQAIREFVTNTTQGSSAEHSTHVKDNKDVNKSLNSSGVSTKSRSSSRKSQRIS